MNTNKNAVMSSLKGSMMVDVIPTKENVDYNRIYLYTKDPGFGRFTGDRELDEKHVREIKKAIETGEYKSKYIAPIRIDINTLNSEDGKHRFEAFKRAWLNGSNEVLRVIYEDLPEDEREAERVIQDINSTQYNWGVPDYEHTLLTQGNVHMLNINKFGIEHTLLQKKNKKGEIVGCYPRYVYAFVKGKNITKDVKKGTIDVTDKELEFGEQMYTEVEQLVDALGYEIGNWFESFIHAWYNIRSTDKLYSEIVDKYGMGTICKHIPKLFEGLQTKTRKTEWENRFRTALWTIKEGIDSKKLVV